MLAPNSQHRARVTPAKRGRGGKRLAQGDSDEPTPAERRASMTPDQVPGRLWAQRLKRVFNIDIEICQACGGAVRIIASIEDPVVIKKILTYLDEKDASVEPARLPPCRAPPQGSLFD